MWVNKATVSSMETLKASQQGLQKIRQARLSKGWTVDDFRWVELASRALGVIWEESGQLASGVSEGTWKRFLAGKQAIKADAFRAYCLMAASPIFWNSRSSPLTCLTTSAIC